MTRTELLQKLKAKRKELADREGIELFMVCTNKALEETVKAMPATLADLALVKGWGKTKIAKYGTDVLDIIVHGNLEDQSPSSLGRPVSKSEGAVFSVAEFLDAVNITLARLGAVRVQGEVSELKTRGAAVYFTLKDTEGEASVKCVLWAWKFEREYSYLEDGMEIVVDALPEVYAKFGTFDLKVERVEPVGEGALQKAFEALKKKLEAKGYFNAARKRPIPAIVRRIGVITSEKGEAINDFLKNIGAYGFEIVLTDVRVEGAQAEDTIVSAFHRMNKERHDLDVICLIRGGGGLENLKAFNTERVAEAVATSRIPVMTGIGHERDVTIASLSSDADFSTPTKVADAIRRGREDMLRAIERQAQDASQCVKELLREALQAAALLAGELQRTPDRVLERARVRISGAAHRMESALGRVFAAFNLLERRIRDGMHRYTRMLQEAQHLISREAAGMREYMQGALQTMGKRIAVASAALVPLNPAAPLQRGYSIVYGPDGKVVKDSECVTIGEYVTVRLYKGKIKSKVEGIDLNENIKA